MLVLKILRCYRQRFFMISEKTYLLFDRKKTWKAYINTRRYIGVVTYPQQKKPSLSQKS